MLKRKNFILVLALAFSALLLIPLGASAAPAAKPRHATAAATYYYVFTGMLMQGGGSLSGGLALQSDKGGHLSGTYRASDGNAMPVTGMVSSVSGIDFTIAQAGDTSIHATGKLNGKMYSGTFDLTSKGKTASGNWSMLSVMKANVEAMAFAGSFTEGKDKGFHLEGAVEFNSKTLKGMLLNAAGTTTPVQVSKKTTSEGNKIKLTIGNNLLVAVGLQVNNAKVHKNPIYQGPLTAPNTDDKGLWEGDIFTF